MSHDLDIRCDTTSVQRVLARVRDERFLPLIGLLLYAVFLGAAWTVMHITSGSVPGILFGPVAAQGAMAIVAAVAARILSRRAPTRQPAVAARRVRALPIVLVALGGFLFQSTMLASYNSLTTSSIAFLEGEMQRPIMLAVLLITSVVGAPLIEEYFFRGLLQPLFGRRNVVVGLLVTASLFGLAHGFDMAFRVLPTLLQGLVLGGVMLLTGRLRAAIAVHALNNSLVLGAMFLLATGGQAPAGVGPTSAPWSFAAYGLTGLLLLGLGLYRMSREPRVSAKLASAV